MVFVLQNPSDVAIAVFSVLVPLMMIGAWASWRLIRAIDRRDANYADAQATAAAVAALRRHPKKKGAQHTRGSRLTLANKKIGANKQQQKAEVPGSPRSGGDDADEENDTGASEDETTTTTTTTTASTTATTATNDSTGNAKSSGPARRSRKA